MTGTTPEPPADAPKPRRRRAPKPSTPDDLLTHVLGAPQTYTSAEVAELAGVSEEVTRSMWRAMGFADVGGERAFTKHDVDALKSLMKLVSTEHLSLEDAIEVARAIGQSTARLAEWESDTIGRMLVERGVISNMGTVTDDEVGPILAHSKVFKPVLERLMVYAWRRQMAAGAARSIALASAGPDARTDQMSVGFADLVGFTRLSRQIPEEDLAQLVQSFETVSADIVAATGARLVKTLGDEVLFVDSSANTVAETAIRLHETHRKIQKFPKMRIGVATGSVVLRMGDVFGTTVNRASRLTAMAKPASTFVDSNTLDELEHNDRYAFRALRPRPARGFGLLRAWSLERPPAD